MSKYNSKTNVHFFKRYRKKAYYAFIVLWLISTIFAWKAFRQPLQLEQKVVDNKIQQKTNIQYNIEVLPCILYPNGGIVKPEGSVITNITNSVKILVDSATSSEKPLLIQGTQGVILKLKADGLWEREFPLGEKTAIHLEGKQNQIIQGEYTIYPATFLNFIEAAEEVTKISPPKYFLTIKPILDGNIKYKDNDIPLDASPELTFEISNSMLNPVTEKDGEFSRPKLIPMDKVEFLQEDVLEYTEIIPLSFNFIGFEMSPILARYIFTCISLLFLTYALYSIILQNKAKNQKLTEAGRIDAKYRKRLIPVNHVFDMSNSLRLQSFNSLVQIADEKEQPIFRSEDTDKKVLYYVIDENRIYLYTADNSTIPPHDLKSKIFLSGSGDITDVK